MFSKDLFIKKDKDYKKYILYQKLAKELAVEKTKIDMYKDNWETIKKICNPYELIYINNINSIAAYIPISRSFFKMWEMIYEFDLLDKIKVMDIACLAEGPGGFIEAIDKYSDNNIYGITLPPSNDGIPSWKKMKTFGSNVKVSYGNLYEIDDILNYYKFIGKNVDLVTADGGIDYSADYNRQEQMSYQIIFSEILTALIILKKGGNFVCKIFDTFSVMTFKILYFVEKYFDSFELYKPKTSRILNSEKYIIAKGFKGVSDHMKKILLYLHKNLDEYTMDIEGFNLPNDFIHKMDNYIKNFSNNQLQFLKESIILAKNKNFENNKYIEKQINNSINWCKKYDMKLNRKSKFNKRNKPIYRHQLLA